MPLWGMQCKSLQIPQMEQFQQVVTVEDHLTDGGFGSWLLESTIKRPDLIVRIQIKALDAKVCGMVGKQSTLNWHAGLRPPSVSESPCA